MENYSLHGHSVVVIILGVSLGLANDTPFLQLGRADINRFARGVCVPVKALVAEGAFSSALVEILALFLLKLTLVVAQQLIFLLLGVDPIFGRANVI